MDLLKISQLKAPTKDWMSFLYWSTKQQSPLLDGIKNACWTDTRAQFIVALKMADASDSQPLSAAEDRAQKELRSAIDMHMQQIRALPRRKWINDEEDDVIIFVPDAIIPCFQNCRSLLPKVNDCIVCSVCSIRYNDCNLCFYRCPKHRVSTCAFCDEHRVNYW